MSTIATPRRTRRTVGGAGDAHQPAFGLHDRVVAGLLPARSGVAEAGDRAVDQPRIARRRASRSRARAWSACPGRKFSTSTSAFAISCSSTRAPSGVLEVERDAFLVAVDAEEVRALALEKRRPQARVSSPLPGCSILMTRAPMSASSIVQYGPDSTRVRSRTVIPSSGAIWDEYRLSSRSRVDARSRRSGPTAARRRSASGCRCAGRWRFPRAGPSSG